MILASSSTGPKIMQVTVVLDSDYQLAEIEFDSTSNNFNDSIALRA